MAPRKKSKRQRRINFVVYIMILAIFVFSLATGLSVFIQ